MISAEADLEKIFDMMENDLINRGMVGKGDQIVMTAGWPPLKHGTTSLLRVATVRKDLPTGKGTKKPAEQVLGYRTKKAQFVLDQNLCIQCGGCVEVCPNDIFGIQNRRVYIKEPNCKNCTFDDACMEICPTNAVEVLKLSD